MNKKLLIALLGTGAVLLIIGITSTVLILNRTPENLPSPTATPLPVTSQTPVVSVSPTTLPATTSPVANPTVKPTVRPTVPTYSISNTKINTIYLCKFNNADVLFLKNGSDRNFSLFQTIDDSPVTQADVVHFTQCKEVYAGGNREEIYFSGYVMTADKSVLYLSYTYDSTNSYQYPNISILIKYNTLTGQKSVLAKHGLLGSSLSATEIAADPFKDLHGAIDIYSLMNDKYLILMIGECYGCGYSSNTYYVLNTQNNQYKLLMADVGAFSLNTATNTISYRELVVTGQYPDCPADDCNITQPIGTAHTTTLP